MRKNIFILLAATLLLLKSCYYMDGGSYFEDVSIDSIPIVEFTTNFDEMDSIPFSDSILFTYQIDIDTADLYYVDLYFDEYWIYNAKQKEDSIYIGPYNIDNNTYTVTMVVVYKTYTGSLSDILNLEGMTVDREWEVVLDQPLK